MRYSLNGAWRLSGSDNLNPENTLKLDAKVPGNVELDLYRNGIEPEPFFGENEYKYQKYEGWDWTFTRKISVPEFDKDAYDVFLVFDGLNCVADIYIDDKHVCSCDNALIPHKLSLRDKNNQYVDEGREYTLKVIIHSAILSAADKSMGNPVNISACEGDDEYTRLRMPAHSFGWDIMPRFPSAGMYRDVYLEILPRDRINQTYFAVKYCDERFANIVFKYRLNLENKRDFTSYTIKVYLDGELKNEFKPHFVSGEGNIYIDNPRLWWPRGYGDSPVYIARTELWYKDALIDSKTETIGVRQVEIVHKMASGDEGEFLIKVNNCPILAKGANWVPLDAFHSRDGERYDRALELFTESNCNIMRLWGGNIYESDRLFEFCDRNGILVWHDFSFACAIYPQSEAESLGIKEEADAVIRCLRNHPCILLWAGDNEIDETYCGRNYYTASNRYNRISREILAESVRENDPFRMYLPSSPYIDHGIERYKVPEQHLWGPRGYYKEDFYSQTQAHFVSEYGYHGCPAAESLRRFIPEQELDDMYSGSWLCHSSEYAPFFKRGFYRNQLMRDHVELMFGSPEHDLETFSFLSQFVQSEALKYMIEQTRLKKWRRTGLIWWNMLDGWPGISDSVVDWYFVKKRSFNAAKRAQEPISVMLTEVNGWSRQIVLLNDSREDAVVNVKITDADTGSEIFAGSFKSRANENSVLGEVKVMPSKQQLCLIEFTYDGQKHKSHYLGGFPPFKIEDAIRWARMIDEE